MIEFLVCLLFNSLYPSSPPSPRHNLFSGILRKQKVGGRAKRRNERLLFSSIIRKIWFSRGWLTFKVLIKGWWSEIYLTVTFIPVSMRLRQNNSNCEKNTYVHNMPFAIGNRTDAWCEVNQRDIIEQVRFRHLLSSCSVETSKLHFLLSETSNSGSEQALIDNQEKIISSIKKNSHSPFVGWNFHQCDR